MRLGIKSNVTDLITIVKSDAFVESFIGSFRDECLDDTLFSTLVEARQAIRSWKEDYNQQRPHSALGNITPAEFAIKSTLETQAA